MTGQELKERAEAQRRHGIQRKLAGLPAAISTRKSAVPTGFPALDRVLGIGGFPRGALTELFGPPSAGKTTLALQWVASVQEAGLSAAWIDADRAFDPAYAAALGVSLERLPLARPESAEQAIEMARRLALSGALDALVVDSVAALVPQLEIDSVVAGGPDLQSRTLSSGLRSLVRDVVKTDTAVLFLNQMRSRMSAASENGETTAGGPALKLYAAVRLVLTPAGMGAIRFRTLKNKAAAAFSGGLLRRGGGAGFVQNA